VATFWKWLWPLALLAVIVIGDQIVVTYAQQDAQGEDDVAGALETLLVTRRSRKD